MANTQTGKVKCTYYLWPDVAAMFKAYRQLTGKTPEDMANLIFEDFFKKEAARIKRQNFKLTTLDGASKTLYADKSATVSKSSKGDNPKK